MPFRLCAAEAGLPALVPIVCPNSIHPHPSEEKRVESHLHSSCPEGALQLRLHADWLQCVLIDTLCSFAHERETQERGRGHTKHGVAQKAHPAGFLCFSSNTIICVFCQFSLTPATTRSLPEEDPLAHWMITAAVPKYTASWQIATNCYTVRNEEIQGVINDKWNSHPQGDSVHGERK